ncbi:MAG: hypothetical protein N3B15_08020 [Planctomycetota bacterium]|nr:hypothetical protein [Planctomycetota bacterium]
MSEALYTFDDAARVVRIHRHDTPGAWINYLSNGELHALVSQAGGGLLWWRSPSVFRLTRYRFRHLPADAPGFYVYLRRPDGSVWSPSGRPCTLLPSRFCAEHRPGRTAFRAERDGLAASLELFICPDHDALVWDLELSGEGELSVFAYAEWSQPHWELDFKFGYYFQCMLHTGWEADEQCAWFLPHRSGTPLVSETPLSWFACDAPVADFDTSRDAFIGPYRDERDPLAVARGQCSNSVIECGEPCAALRVPLVLQRGQPRRLRFFLGAVGHALRDWEATVAKRRATLAALRQPGAVEEQRAKLDAWWDRHLARFAASLPLPEAQRMITIWNPVGSVHTARYSRSISAQATGERAFGFRDTTQDALAITYRDPSWGLAILRQQLRHQFADGHTVHEYNLWERRPFGLTVHSDEHHWLAMLAYAIAAESGDLSFLDEPVPFLGPDCKPAESAPVWEHLRRIVSFTESHLGAHGLPLTLHSDWNDIIGRFARQGRGESVFAGQQHVITCRLLAELARASGREADAAWFDDCRRRQVQALETHAWDGAWWRRAFDDDGTPVGAASCAFGRIFLNPQSWAVLSGIGTLEQRRRGMDEAGATLDTGFGLKLLHPGFATYPQVRDPFSGYMPGTGENGAIFCHANTWAVIAEALLGRGERAWKYYLQLLPERVIAKVGAERYTGEPYAWASTIIGPENNRAGWATITQSTGTVAWMDVAATQYLLGLRAELAGLRIAPCIPRSWPGFTAERVFRGCRVRLEVDNRAGVESGVRRAWLDGEELPCPCDPAQPCAGVLVPAARLQGRSRAELRVELG